MLPTESMEGEEVVSREKQRLTRHTEAGLKALVSVISSVIIHCYTAL